MNFALDLVAAVGFLVLSAAFFLAPRIGGFGAAAGAALATAAVVLRRIVLADGASIWEAAVVGAGLCLYGLGLSMVRLMLLRSVSLSLLLRKAEHRNDADATEAFVARLLEAQRYGLVSMDGDHYRLTTAGRCLAGAALALYTLTGNRS
jgi:hypothetical protein